MKNQGLRLILLLVIALPAWYFTDMDSPSRLQAYVLPIIAFICFMGLCLWLIDQFTRIGRPEK